MTFYALRAIKEANYRLTYAQLHTRLQYDDPSQITPSTLNWKVRPKTRNGRSLPDCPFG